jgi:enoyl-CoA hydratase
MPDYATLTATLADGVARVTLNRPHKANAADATTWRELRAAFGWADTTPAVRVVILAGAGAHFCAGIDLEFLTALRGELAAQPDGHRQERLRARIAELQADVNAIEQCRKPVIAAIQGVCIGGAIDLIAACDLRYAVTTARFSVKEVDLGIVADLGTLQRLPRLVGEGVARELAYTGREFDGEEAARLRLVNAALPDRDALEAHVQSVARTIAAKSPLAVRGIKEVMNYGRDHDVAEGLAQVATRNAALLFAPDLDEALAAHRARRPATYPD